MFSYENNVQPSCGLMPFLYQNKIKIIMKIKDVMVIPICRTLLVCSKEQAGIALLLYPSLLSLFAV
jgi:hypothetical protein